MEKLHFSIYINAPKEKVWHTMLDDATYRQWTEVFNPGSCYVGNWDAGSEMQFLGTDENGNLYAGGMYARIKESRLYEYVSIQHLGLIMNGVIDTTSDEVKNWAPACEDYTFREKDGGTELLIDLDSNAEHKEMFEGLWPKSLEVLKSLCEA
jgi:L-rhamnose mutarotase